MLALALMGLLPPERASREPRLLGRGDANERDLAQLNEKAWRAVRGPRNRMVFQSRSTSLNPVMRIRRTS